MKRLIAYINKYVLANAVKLHSAQVLTKIFAGMLTTKFIAVFINPEAMALIGNMRSFLTSIQSFGTVGLYNGLVKFIGMYKQSALKLSKTLSTSYFLGFLATGFICMGCYYNAQYINDFLFSDNYNYAWIIKIMALALPFYSLNLFSFAIMNGFAKYRFLMIINIIGQIMGLSVTLLLIWQNRVEGALIAVVIAPSLMFLITLVGILNRKNLSGLVRVANFDFEWLKKFQPFILMALVSGVAFPLVIILIRNYIIQSEGLKEAGYWEAMNRISSYYLMFINSIMTLYFLPRFAEIDTKEEFRKEIKTFYKSIIPILLAGLVVIYLIRPFIIQLLLTDEFQPVEDLFSWQLLGDFIKVLSVVIAYHFIAKKMFWHFIITETFLLIITYITSIYFIDLYGVVGANIGHFASYVMYFLVILLLIGSSLFGIIQEPDTNSQ